MFDQKSGDYGAPNLGISGDLTEQLLYRVEHGALSLLNPSLIVVTIGVNNFVTSKNAPSAVAEGVEAIVRLLRQRIPKAKVLLLGCFPASAKGTAVASKIHALNASLARLNRLSGVHTLDLSLFFLRGSGGLNRDRIHEDAGHLRDAGDVVWAEAILP